MGETVHIIYHEDWDGIVAAWIAVKELSEPGRSFKLHPINYGQKPPEIPKHRMVFILDFSFPPEEFDEFYEGRTDRVVMLDHHKTAIKKYSSWRVFKERTDGVWLYDEDATVIFEDGVAGCEMTWKFLNHKYNLNAKTVTVPLKLIQYAADHDLYKFKLSDSKIVRAVMRSYPQTLASCDELAQRLENGISVEFQAEGEAILRFMDRQIESSCKYAELMKIAGHKCLGAQVPFDALISEVAGRLSKNKDVDFGLCWFKIEGNKWVYSLRSRNDFDVSEVAEQFDGGGGHKNAAGFTCGMNPVNFLSL